MTYIQPLEISSTQSQGTLGAPASIAANERMPCGPITHTGITVNAQGQLVLSANQTTHIIMGAAYIETDSSTGTIEVQWYDVTNSAWLGRSQESWVATSSNSYPRTSVARCVVVPSVSTIIEFRVVSVGPISRINVNSLASGYGGRAWYGAISF